MRIVCLNTGAYYGVKMTGIKRDDLSGLSEFRPNYPCKFCGQAMDIIGHNCSYTFYRCTSCLKIYRVFDEFIVSIVDEMPDTEVIDEN